MTLLEEKYGYCQVLKMGQWWRITLGWDSGDSSGIAQVFDLVYSGTILVDHGSVALNNGQWFLSF